MKLGMMVYTSSQHSEGRGRLVYEVRSCLKKQPNKKKKNINNRIKILKKTFTNIIVLVFRINIWILGQININIINNT